MVTVATGLDVPIKMLIPLFFPTSEIRSFTLIGLGDIVLPGLMVCFALRFDQTKELDWKSGYFACERPSPTCPILALVRPSSKRKKVFFKNCCVCLIFLWGGGGGNT